MSKHRLNLGDLAVASFEPLAPSANASLTIAVATATVIEVTRAQYDTLEQICWCMTWVAEDCFGPTAGSECSTGEGSVAQEGNLAAW